MGLFKATFSRIRKGLSRTASSLGGGLRSILLGRKIDEDLLDEIEAKLISADVGVVAALSHPAAHQRHLLQRDR